MRLLIDADYVVYKACAAAEYDIDWGNDLILVGSRFSEAYANVKRDIERIQSNFFDPYTILFFSDSVNFRKQVDPSYKGQQSGWEWFLIQTLAGDSTDGYAGAPGFGVKTSAKFFGEYGYTWNSVVKAFESKNMTEEDALRNARLAKILTADDYQNGQPKLFNPSDADSRTYDGTGVQTSSDEGPDGERTKGKHRRDLSTSTTT